MPMDPAWSHWPSKSPFILMKSITGLAFLFEATSWFPNLWWKWWSFLFQVQVHHISPSPPCIFPPLVGLSLMSVVSVLLPHPWAPRGSLAQISWSCPQLWQDMFVLTQQQWSLSGLCFKHRNKTTTHEKHGRVGGGVVKPDFTFPPEWLLLPSSFQPYCSSTMISYQWNLLQAIQVKSS